MGTRAVGEKRDRAGSGGTTRRVWLRRVVPVALGVGGVVGVAACSRREALKCDDVTGLPEEVTSLRQKLGYQEKAEKPELACRNCAQWVEPSSPGCGTCRIMGGPIHPDGGCRVFAPKG